MVVEYNGKAFQGEVRGKRAQSAGRLGRVQIVASGAMFRNAVPGIVLVLAGAAAIGVMLVPDQYARETSYGVLRYVVIIGTGIGLILLGLVSSLELLDKVIFCERGLCCSSFLGLRKRFIRYEEIRQITRLERRINGTAANWYVLRVTEKPKNDYVLNWPQKLRERKYVFSCSSYKYLGSTMESLIRKCFLLCLLLLLPAAAGCGEGGEAKPFEASSGYLSASEVLVEEPGKADVEAGLNPYGELSVPTYAAKIGDKYFLVDCYHNQIIYNDNLTEPLSSWRVLTDEIDRGHTIAGDGLVYVADDTENNRVLVFEEGSGGFVLTQVFSDIGVRPHYVVYDERTDTFYVWSSMSGEMFLFRHEQGDSRMYLTDIRRIPSLNGVYVRSFTIVGDDIYFVSGNSSIIRARLSDFRVEREYPVPEEIAGMIQLTPIGGDYYITVSTDSSGNQDYATIIRAESLEELADYDYEDVYGAFIGGGTPYYISSFDNRYYLTEHRVPGHSLWSFRVENHLISDVEAVY